MEDLDPPRTVKGAADDILRTLESLGLLWDGAVLYQSRRHHRYEAALEQLREKNLLFPCTCSRSEIVASAPHFGQDGPIYPGTCRKDIPRGRRPAAVRIKVPEKSICVSDGVFGALAQGLAESVGDFVLRRADGVHAYQLAVIVDDAESGVNQVVRGADLLCSTPRQVFLQSCLGLSVPQYFHLPLALSADGRKMSKRDGGISTTPLDGALLERTLRFLGQKVPVELRGAPSLEVMDWACGHFDPKRIPRESRMPGYPEREGSDKESCGLD